MPVTRQAKEAAAAELREKLGRARVVILSDYRGLNVAALTLLRRRLREAEGEFKVVKNTVAKRVAAALGLGDLLGYLEGPTAMAFGYGDPALSAKVLSDFAREFRQLEVKGGILEGRVVPPEQVKALASLPPRPVLLAQVVGGVQAPLYGLVGALGGVLRGLVYALEGIRKLRAEEA
ncbi:MAG: 50S ribosomal protein L10 [Firmicutes bacterium]|nr:50S ribosomal protein L10 [Bacillota bacterium]